MLAGKRYGCDAYLNYSPNSAHDRVAKGKWAEFVPPRGSTDDGDEVRVGTYCVRSGGGADFFFDPRSSRNPILVPGLGGADRNREGKWCLHPPLVCVFRALFIRAWRDAYSILLLLSQMST